MTQQLTRHARKAMDRVEAEIEDAREALNLLMTHRHDPHYVKDRGEEIYDALARLEWKLEKEIEPYLLRREPSVEQRLAELEARIADLESERRPKL